MHVPYLKTSSFFKGSNFVNKTKSREHLKQFKEKKYIYITPKSIESTNKQTNK